MGEQTGIAWCDMTFNPWWGCTKISPACDHCYAERDAKRFQPGVELWGGDAVRLEFGDKHWNNPHRWNRRAIKEGRALRVFCASMADVFDKNAPAGARERLWATIKATPKLDWLLLTKRIGNAAEMLPADWGAGYPNVWLGITVVNQDEVERDVPKLLRIPARVRWLSMEPLLGPVSFEGLFANPHDYRDGTNMLEVLDWVVVGGESGPGARPMQQKWVRSIADQCYCADTAFFMKQGSQANWPDFKNFDSFPSGFQLREFPVLFR